MSIRFQVGLVFLLGLYQDRKILQLDRRHMARNSSVVTESPYSLASLISFLNNNFALIFIVGLFFLGGFFIGSLWTENQMLRSGRGAGTPTQPVAADPTLEGPTGPTAEQLKLAPTVTDEDHIRGSKDAKIVLIEYSDYECTFCARFHPTIKAIKEEFGDDVAWVFRHYPLSFHPNAQKAAEASECVAEQRGAEGFWAYTDAIFESTQTLGSISAANITQAAEGTGANMITFQECLDSGKMAQKVTDQMTGGSNAGISGTPGTIILTKDGNAELINGALPLEQVRAMVQNYL